MTFSDNFDSNHIYEIGDSSLDKVVVDESLKKNSELIAVQESGEGGEIKVSMGCIMSANEVNRQDKKPFLSLTERREQAKAERKSAKSLVRNLVHEEFGR